MPATGGLKRVALGALLLLSSSQGQTQSFCEGELGEAGWECPILSPVPAQVGDKQTYSSNTEREEDLPHTRALLVSLSAVKLECWATTSTLKFPAPDARCIRSTCSYSPFLPSFSTTGL